MSFIQRKIIAANGVRKFLEKKGVTVSSRKIAKITGEFLKYKNLPYVTWNNRYKGINTADLINSIAVQEHWNEFVNWYNQQQ